MIGPVLLLLLAVLGPAARAADPQEWVGMPIAGVQHSAPEGGLPEESLTPLLRATQGSKLDPAVVRLDLETLYRVGAFRAVEAHVEPWLTYDALGREVDAVLLTYEVYPAPKVHKVKIVGGDPIPYRQLLEMASVTPGQGTWFPELEATRVADAMEKALYRKGWIRAKVKVDAKETPDGLDVTIHIDEGQPNVLETLAFTGDIAEVDPSGNQRRLRKWARRAGVVEGKPFDPEAVGSAQAEIRTELAALPGLFSKRGGWINARVTPAMMRTGAGTARVSFAIEAGPQLELDIQGMGFRGRSKVVQALGIDERLRLTRGWTEEAPERLTQAVQNDGFLNADVEVAIDETADGNTIRLDVHVDRGARHWIKSGGYPGQIGVAFEGNDTLTDADLQRVLDQASPEVIRRDYYSEAELKKGLATASQVYQARGHLEAQLALQETKTRPRRRLPFGLISNPIRRLLGGDPPIVVMPRVSVQEGPLTTLSEALVLGASGDVDIQEFEDQLTAMQGEAFSPQRIETITRKIVEAHRALGYLYADAKVETSTVDPLVRSVAIAIRPGAQVRLRSKVTKGLSRTRPAFVRREADIEPGDPVTPAALDRVRNNLYDLGIFRTVRLDLLGDEAARDLVIDVSERPRFAYELGGGLSTDQGIRAFGRYSWRNLWGRAHRIDVIGQVGLVYGSDAVTDWIPDIKQPDWRLALSYTAPRFPLRSQQLVFDAVREVRLERTWRMSRMGAGVALDWEFGRVSARRLETTLRIAPRLETRQLREVDIGALLPGEPWIRMIQDGLPSRWRVQEKIQGLLLVDRRDDRILPRKGVLSNTTAEIAPGLPWDEWRQQPVSRFVKAETRLSSYVPLGGFVLELSGSAGHAFSLDNGVIPLEDRFRLGGTGSVRGFERDAIGPRNRTSRVDIDWPSGLGPLVDYATRNDPERWVPTGGDTKALATIELLLPLPALGLPNWDGYALELFADVGNVWLLGGPADATTDLPEFQALLPAMRVGVGTGMRVETPVGPLQVDVGVNPQSAWSSNAATRDLLFTDFEEPRWRVHLTLGATF